jgi:hypothetical protein
VYDLVIMSTMAAKTTRGLPRQGAGKILNAAPFIQRGGIGVPAAGSPQEMAGPWPAAIRRSPRIRKSEEPRTGLGSPSGLRRSGEDSIVRWGDFMERP